MVSINFSPQLAPSSIDSNERLRIYILWYIFTRVVTLTLLLGITLFLQSKGRLVILPSTSITIVFISIIYIYSIGSAGILQKMKTRLRRFGVYQLVLDCLTSAFLVYATGCSQSIFTPLFIIPIITGGLILYTIGGLIPATAATLLYATVLFFEYTEYLPPYFAGTHYQTPVDPLASMNIFSIYGLLFFLTGFLSGLLGSRLKSTEAALSITSRQLDQLSVLYQQIFNDITIGIITIDAYEQITSFNPAAIRITGYRNEEVINRKLTRIFPELNQSEVGRRVGDLQRKGGEMARIVYSFSTLNISDNHALQGNDYNSWKIITIEDISKIEQLEKQILEAQNMAAIGELSANIAHDFRNPLAAIYGSAQIISLELENDAPKDTNTQQRLTDIILRESERMADTVSEFLQFARPDTLTNQWFNLKRLVTETVNQIVSTKTQYSACAFKYTISDNLDIWGDRQQIQSALNHLLINSCNASKDTVNIPVEITASEEIWEKKNTIVIKISDKGVGISAENQGKIFDPFFSTSEQGSGLGLSIVKQAINRHHGTIECRSKEGQDCLFTLRLPLPANPDTIIYGADSDNKTIPTPESS